MPRRFAGVNHTLFFFFFFFYSFKRKKAERNSEARVNTERKDGQFWETHRLL